MASNTYDRFGFDKYGYNREGYDRMGYNREGYDKEGFNRRGVNKFGINKLSGRDKDGFDHDGFDMEGYDRSGFDREGYNRDGFDENGYDRDGYNKDGYNESGYDKDGFDPKGFDIDGFGKDGFNQSGYDRNGFNRQGYNIEGYDKLGFNRGGRDREGYDRDGYDKNGYNRMGYNQDGYDKEGYNVDGYDFYGFDREGYDINGMSLWGRNIDGISILGFGVDGFNQDGITIEGYSRDEFDEEGFHIYQGLNIKGFDRDGFNINGLDEEGYDRDGFGLDGYNRFGYDRDGYNRGGYDENGYDKDGYSYQGFDSLGYDREGYNSLGYDKYGYNKSGFDSRGYDAAGYDKDGNLDLNKVEVKHNKKVDINQDKLERQYFSLVKKEITDRIKPRLTDDALKDLHPILKTTVDMRTGMVMSIREDVDNSEVLRCVERQVSKLLSNPYFAHVDYAETPELYLGKESIPGWVTDWADDRASYYYQYEIYVGNKKAGINFVRDIHVKNGAYVGYSDKYNNTQNNVEVNLENSHLSQLAHAADSDNFKRILEQNQKNKQIHDIIESIQQNQYKIITANKNLSMLVVGCAGSGKTMILMHKIRYMKYHDKDLDMSDIIVISPTNILQRESKELSRLLQIDKTMQFTTSSLYEYCIKQFFDNNELPYEDIFVQDSKVINPKEYSFEFLNEASRIVRKYLDNDKEFIKDEKKSLDEMVSSHKQILYQNGIAFDEMYKLYGATNKEIQNCSKKDVEKLIARIKSEYKEKENYDLLKDFVQFLIDKDCFDASEDINSEKSFSTRFLYTMRLFEQIDMDELMHISYFMEIPVSGKIQVIEFLNTVTKITVAREEIYKVLREWTGITRKYACSFLEYLQKEIDNVDILKKKEQVLSSFIENNYVFGKTEESNSLRIDSSFNAAIKLYIETEDTLLEREISPMDYFDQYSKILRKVNRYKEQIKIKGRRQYFFDVLLKVFQVEYSLEERIEMTQTQAFGIFAVMCNVLGPLCQNRKYIFIDEFQDFSDNELRIIKYAFPNAKFHLFGDVYQCINAKGIKNTEDIPKELFESEEKILENYRNARQITNYVNDTLGLGFMMLPVGLTGKCEQYTNIPFIDIEKDDRVAVIVANGKVETVCTKLDGFLDYNIFSDEKGIQRGKYNVIPVSMTKGLEFEKVIVITDGMNTNERYVAFTRAIKELHIVALYEKANIYDSEEIDDNTNEIQENIIGKSRVNIDCVTEKVNKKISSSNPNALKKKKKIIIVQDLKNSRKKE